MLITLARRFHACLRRMSHAHARTQREHKHTRVHFNISPVDRLPFFAFICSYLRAIFGGFLAARYIYKQGLNANEFAFFEYMQQFLVDS